MTHNTNTHPHQQEPVLNRPGFELIPRSWTNFKGFHEEVDVSPISGHFQTGVGQKYQTEFKLEVVKSFLAGEGGAKLLARQWSVPEVVQQQRGHSRHCSSELARMLSGPLRHTA